MTQTPFHLLYKDQFKFARDVMRHRHKVYALLANPVEHPKVSKNMKLDVFTAPLHLAPARVSGYEVCPMASKGCRRACLNTAGNPAYAKGKRRARNAKTRAFFRARGLFMIALAGEISKHEVKAQSLGMKSGIRLNATSDIRWESMPLEVPGVKYDSLMRAFPDTSFYDYTKDAKRWARVGQLPNYDLTFSRSESNEGACLATLEAGVNVAAVFSTLRNHPLPPVYNLGGEVWQVIDGDVHDYRPADKKGVIVGLRAKGKGRKDKTGFVIQI